MLIDSSTLEYCTLPPSAPAALEVLAAPVSEWFKRQHGTPTSAQCLAWPVLAQGKHLQLCAPTGSGKTLAAFLPILSDLLTQPSCGCLRALYVAPLKALVQDVA